MTTVKSTVDSQEQSGRQHGKTGDSRERQQWGQMGWYPRLQDSFNEKKSPLHYYKSQKERTAQGSSERWDGKRSQQDRLPGVNKNDNGQRKESAQEL